MFYFQGLLQIHIFFFKCCGFIKTFFSFSAFVFFYILQNFFASLGFSWVELTIGLESIYQLIVVFISGVLVIICILLCVAFFIVFERKLLSSTQQRLGPNTVGYLGLLQSIADAIKMLAKEMIIPLRATKKIFLIAPQLLFILSLVSWIVIPFNFGITLIHMNLGIIFILLISSMNVYAIILSGWASNNRYAFLGSLRSSAQMISYELAMGTALLNVFVLSGSLNLSEVVNAQKSCWFIIPLFPAFIIFLLCGFAETNRSPFDLPEAESELVSGYNTEHSGFPFAYFFLGEYTNILLMSNLIVLLFCGGWLLPFLENQSILLAGFAYIAKVFMFTFCFVWVRTTLPRLRYDQLMRFGWKILLPVSLFFFFLSVILVWSGNGFAPVF